MQMTLPRVAMPRARADPRALELLLLVVAIIALAIAGGQTAAAGTVRPCRDRPRGVRIRRRHRRHHRRRQRLAAP